MLHPHHMHVRFMHFKLLASLNYTPQRWAEMQRLHPLAFANLWGPVRYSFCGCGRGRCLRIGPSGLDRAVVVRGVVVGGVVVQERVVVLEVGVGEGRKKRTV